MKKIKTLQSLNEKVWYRLLKVIYLLIILGTVVGLALDTSDYFSWEFIKELLIAAVIFEAIRRIFYYIVLGRLNPKSALDEWNDIFGKRLFTDEEIKQSINKSFKKVSEE